MTTVRVLFATHAGLRPHHSRPRPALLVLLVAALAACRGGAPTTTGASPTMAAGTRAAPVAWSAVDSIMGRVGAAQAGGVRRWSMPRTDLAVEVRGVRVRPALALGSWLAMLPEGGGVVAAGDLVLLEDEVAPVMAALQAGGVAQTAVHHHLLHESPRIVYVHVHAMGDPAQIARAVRAALDRTGTPAAAPAPLAAATETFPLDTAALRAALGRAGRVTGGVYQVSVPRAETIRDAGVPMPASMGVATALNFQPTGEGRAAITGDFVLTAAEVNPVLRALFEGGIEVTSLHNHMLDEEPRLFFMHFWANADAESLARALRSALDRANSAKPPLP